MTSGKPKVRKRVPNVSDSIVQLGDLYDGKTDNLIPLSLFTVDAIKKDAQNFTSKSKKPVPCLFSQKLNDFFQKKDINLEYEFRRPFFVK